MGCSWVREGTVFVRTTVDRLRASCRLRGEARVAKPFCADSLSIRHNPIGSVTAFRAD
jgi:hypothetical protein